jgi:hypothetical protein
MYVGVMWFGSVCIGFIDRNWMGVLLIKKNYKDSNSESIDM